MRGDTEITNREDILDSRNIINRIDYLEYERSTLNDKVDEAKEALQLVPEEDQTGLTEAIDKRNDAEEALIKWDESDEGQELKALKALQDQAEGYSEDWCHGAILIRDTYFTEYAEQLADDIGAIDKNQSWPLTCIDWEKAADELKQDYTSVDFDGVDYWIR